MQKTFPDTVRDIVRAIPKGKTMSYREVAAKAGNSRAARAVARIMAANFDFAIPCHRVRPERWHARRLQPRRRVKETCYTAS